MSLTIDGGDLDISSVYNVRTDFTMVTIEAVRKPTVQNFLLEGQVAGQVSDAKLLEIRARAVNVWEAFAI